MSQERTVTDSYWFDHSVSLVWAVCSQMASYWFGRHNVNTTTMAKQSLMCYFKIAWVEDEDTCLPPLTVSTQPSSSDSLAHRELSLATCSPASTFSQSAWPGFNGLFICNWWNTSNHSSIFFHLSGIRWQWQQDKQSVPDVPLSSDSKNKLFLKPQ